MSEILTKDAAVLTDVGFVSCYEILAGTKIPRVLTGGAVEVVDVKRCSLSYGECQHGPFVKLPRSKRNQNGPDASITLLASQRVFYCSVGKRARGVEAQCLPSVTPVERRETLEIVLIIFETPTLLCANGLVLESTVDLETLTPANSLNWR